MSTIIKTPDITHTQISHLSSSLDVVVGVPTEATAEAGDAGAAGGVGDDHLGPGVLLLNCGDDVVGLNLGRVGLVDGGLLGVASVSHLLEISSVRTSAGRIEVLPSLLPGTDPSPAQRDCTTRRCIAC